MSAPPEGVLHLEETVDVNGLPRTWGLWMLLPDAGSGYPLYWSGLVSSFQLQVQPAALELMHSGARFSTCRLLVGGVDPYTWVETSPPNHGRATGGQAANVALGIYLQSLSGGRGSGTRLRLYGIADDCIDSNYRVSYDGVSYLQQFCDALELWASSVTGPTGAALSLGTLQTRRAGAPVVPPTFDPLVSLRPSFRVERLGRRLPRSGAISPT